MESKKEKAERKIVPHLPRIFCPKKPCQHMQQQEKLYNIFLELHKDTVIVQKSSPEFVKKFLATVLGEKLDIPESSFAPEEIYLAKYCNLNAPPRFCLTTVHSKGCASYTTKIFPLQDYERDFQIRNSHLSFYHDKITKFLLDKLELYDEYDPSKFFLDLGLEIRYEKWLDTNNYMGELCNGDCLCSCEH